MMIGRGPPGEFGVTFDFLVGNVVVAVRGEVDVATAPELGHLLEALVDMGHLHLTLDLAELDFMDAAGLRVIADTAARVQPSGALSLRSLPAITRRILDLTGVTQQVRLESPAGSKRMSTASLSSAKGERAELAEAFNRAAASPGTDVVDAALGLVAALARATVAGTDGVGVSLHRHGRLSTVASTDETAAQLDRRQYATGQGPCVAATTEGRRFHVESSEEESRWPEFMPAAVAAGMASVLSTPLVAANRSVGALNLYSRTARAFGPEEQALATLFATKASEILTSAGGDRTADELEDRLDDALHAREVIAQGQGVLMERHGISSDAAYASLRRSARDADRPVRQEAASVLASSAPSSRPGEVRPTDA